ncbi:hypothetical protein C6W96_05860 [Streptomyces sp. CS149]|nr:hypothetical protein C6W96_05860 [Streptomyces sp. CS149]
MTTARPRLEKITADNVLDACRLEVAPEQRRFVSPVAQSLAEAYVHPDLGGVRRIMAGSATPGTAPRSVAETPESLRDEDVPAPCDAPHQTPRPDRP